LTRDTRGLSEARCGVDERAATHRVPEHPRPRLGGGARGGGRHRLPHGDHEPARPRIARELVPAVRGERGSAHRARCRRPCVEARADRRRTTVARGSSSPSRRPLPNGTVSRSLLHRRRSRTSASHLACIGHAPIPRPAAPTCSLRPRREDAPADAGLRRRRGRGNDAADVERERPRDGLDAVAEAEAAEVDATLRPLARALLALAEQLMGEEAP